MSTKEISQPRILKHFHLCGDPRKHRIQHNLIDILMIVVLGTICGEEGWEGFYDWAQDKEDYLRTYLSLEHGIPSPDTLRRVMERLDASQFLQAFIAWAEEIEKRTSGQICIDGKALRKAADPLHIVSAWSEANRMVIGSSLTDGKGKEIPAIEDLLDLLILKEKDVVTIDAIGCQKSIVEKITKQKADYVIALKGNQQGLAAEAENYFFQALKAPDLAACTGVGMTEEKRGRHDVHEVWATSNLDWLPQRSAWSGLKSFILVERRWNDSKGQHKEHRYYISSLEASAEEFAYLIRQHWSIENEFHWHLDVTFREDASALSREANRSLRVARILGLNMLRSERTFKRGLKAKMRRCHRSETYLNQVLDAANF